MLALFLHNILLYALWRTKSLKKIHGTSSIAFSVDFKVDFKMHETETDMKALGLNYRTDESLGLECVMYMYI